MNFIGKNVVWVIYVLYKLFKMMVVFLKDYFILFENGYFIKERFVIYFFLI